MPSLKQIQDERRAEEKARIQAEEEAKKEKPKAAVNDILASQSLKDKRFSIRVNSSTYAQFSEINRKRGMANGSVMNGLISEYVREHRDYLDE